MRGTPSNTASETMDKCLCWVCKPSTTSDCRCCSLVPQHVRKRAGCLLRTGGRPSTKAPRGCPAAGCWRQWPETPCEIPCQGRRNQDARHLGGGGCEWDRGRRGQHSPPSRGNWSRATSTCRFSCRIALWFVGWSGSTDLDWSVVSQSASLSWIPCRVADLSVETEGGEGMLHLALVVHQSQT